VKLNHLDLQVLDVPAASEFFVRHFAFERLTRADSPAIAILTDGEGFTLVLQRRTAVSYPEGFHIGFIVDDPAEVYVRRAALADAGLDVSPVQVNGRGTMCYCHGPSGVLVEVSSRGRA
jgi:catechol 2,3-dioxygenase-like lactoylglutathione lyase family enzyme